VGERYVNGGGIRDLSVTVEDATGLDGVAIHVKAYDIMRNQEVDSALPFVGLI
jgi:hypothetical protein